MCLYKDTIKKKNTNITAKKIMRKIKNNERFAKIIETVKVMSDKYGPITAAGGSLVDCYFNKDFYDIDLFISVEDLKDEFKKDYEQRSHILDVLRDELDGEALDIIVVDYSVKEHIRRFDQNFKKIFYSNGRIGILKEAVEDISNGVISVGNVNGPTVYFRCIKSSEKYGLKVNPDDLYIMHNMLTYIWREKGHINLAKKYWNYRDRFVPAKCVDIELAKSTKKYTRQYWDINRKNIISFSEFKESMLNH